LYFFRGPLQTRGGIITLDGPADFHGAQCWKVSFKYYDGLTFSRYFDQQTGALRGTVTDLGHTEIIESGKLLAGGIAFPDTIQSYSDGKLVRTMKFSHILVNEPISDSVFEVPSASVLLPTPNETAPAGSPDTSAAPVPTGVSGAASPPPTDIQAAPAGSAAPGSNNSINVPPATPQTNEQPLMFNIKPTN
ncbi:MAG: hypothetical protein ABSH19_04470, partial [Opitutales bacterium]